MHDNAWSEKDKENLIELLKLLASKAKFDDMKVEDSIKLTQLITWTQRDVLRKIDSHILEVKAVKEEPKPKTKAKKGKK